jgi:hypothetical protein
VLAGAAILATFEFCLDGLPDQRVDDRLVVAFDVVLGDLSFVLLLGLG